jgi:dipeptidyl aminopeptidase/acylaminoacyl peptidase
LTSSLQVGAALLGLCAAVLSWSVAVAEPTKRAVTVADAICMTKLTDPGHPANFSPDGSKFVVLLQRGNLTQNTNDYWLLLWRTNRLFSGAKSDLLITMSSSSNRPAIKDVRWLGDNETLMFLGEHPGETQQVYSLDIATHALRRLTQSSTNVVSYTTDAQAEKIVYATERSETRILDAKAKRNGFTVSNQSAFELSSGKKNTADAVFYGEVEFFLQVKGRNPRKLPSGLLSPVEFEPPVMSPDGRYVVILAVINSFPDHWKDYSNPGIQWWTQHKRTPQPTGQRVLLLQPVLFDSLTYRIGPLIDAPTSTSAHSEIAWSPDSQSVAITNSYLPLRDRGGNQGGVEAPVPAVEVSIANRRVAEIGQEAVNSPRWLTDRRIRFHSGESKWQTSSPVVDFEKRYGRWYKLEHESVERGQPEILQQEDLNTPPRLVATYPRSDRQFLLLDLNPQFKSLEFAAEIAIQWKGSDGHDVQGGLYYPLRYEPDRRYPLVIQTHAFRSDKFWIDGPFSTAFAAQPLAAHGIMVLQMEEDTSDSDTPKEVDREVAALEGAIDYMDHLGLIDRSRVGVIGFSRTCLHVKFALTHSRYHFAAASVSDGVDNGYFQYILCNTLTAFDEALEGSNGGLPFGEGLQRWMKRSPGFNLDKVSTPLFIFAPNRDSALFQWEWYAGLKRLNKPVEMLVVDDDEHELKKPWNRSLSLQSTVDWFSFWLNGEEDRDSDKARQYVRWRKFRILQEQNAPRQDNGYSSRD